METGGGNTSARNRMGREVTVSIVDTVTEFAVSASGIFELSLIELEDETVGAFRADKSDKEWESIAAAAADEEATDEATGGGAAIH